MTVPKHGSKFDMRLNPVYQVDWTNQASGKMIAASKRRIRFRFGFSDAEAIRKGATGPACRGEEHDVVLVWSLTSGKRLVTADDKEIHFSLGSLTDNMFETSWTMAGGHVVKLVAYAAPPLFYTPGFRQFDLFIDGCSFFDMPRIFELGIKNKKNQSIVTSPEQSYRNYSVSSLPEQDHFAERPSLEERRVSSSEPALDTTPDVMDLLSSEPLSTRDLLESSPAPVTPQVHKNIYAPQALASDSHTFNSPAQQQQHSAVAIVSPYSPQSYYQQQEQNYYQPQQTYYQPQQTYYQPQQTNNLTPQTPTSVSSIASPPEFNMHTPMLPLTMEPLSVQELDARDEPPVSPLERAVRSLVNLDNIAETIETPEQRKFQQSKVAKQPVRSEPLPPVKPDWTLGLKPRLGEIKDYASPRKQPDREIMRTHVFDPAAAQAGMMVPYGAVPSGYYGHHGGCYYQQPMYAS